jgi:serine/threonine protein kinase
VSEGSPTERFGPYIVYEQLGVGGMAQVHRAVAADGGVQRPVALKRMLSHIANSDEMVKSFVREARLASYLRHENVAQTYDLGRVGETYFIVMELITGRNLREVLRHCGATTGPMPVPVALNILNQVCDALDYAHHLCDETGQPLGIIHRDVSPSNVIVSTGGVVKLIDFGIAKASAAGMQTMSGTLKGKFAYMAPEYIAGRIDARADLFAVGVIAHELLTNRPLFTGRDDIDTLTRVRDMRIDPPSRKNPLVPAEIDDVVMTALARDPDRRWQHATALRTALTTLTRRLGLVASNAQAIEWLDWAFTQKRPSRSGSDSDTQTDGQALDEPSISIQQQTVDLSPISRQTTLLKPGGALHPPARPPTAPAYAPTQHALPGLTAPPGTGPAPGPADRPSAGVGAPRVTANGVAASSVRSSSSIPVRAAGTAPPASARPTSQPAITPSAGAPVAAPPVPRAASASHPSQPLPAVPAARPSSPSQPLAPGSGPRNTLPGTYPPPIPQMPGRHAGPPGAPRSQGGSQLIPLLAPPHPPAPAHEPVRVQPPRAPPSSQGRYSPAVAVLLVVLAAVAAATTVYFVLPLLR